MTNLRSVLLAMSATASVAAIGAMMTGCGTGITSAVNSPVAGNAFQGTVYGGSQPIIGATIQLYAASTNGYGQPYTAYPAGSTSLLTSAVTTTGTGGFSIGGGIFTCPASNPDVYIVATGGNPGLSSGGNANIALMAALGPCESLGPGTHIRINELTTVASVWALSPFMSGIAAVGTSAGNVTGLTNGFATVDKLVDIGVGNLPGPALPPDAVLPVQKMNLLADILASCVNSAGFSTADTSAACNVLFTAATPVSGTAPADTITAALNLAQNPDPSTAALNALLGKVSSSPPFQPVPPTNSEPTDFGLIITYSGGGLSTPKGIAVDSSGNVWTANSGNNSVSEFSNTGAPLSGSTGYPVGTSTAPAAIAIDVSGNAWVANSGNNTVSEIAPGGATVTAFSGGSLSAPVGVAIDASNNVWVANSGGGGSVTEITPGTTPTYANYTGGGIAAPGAIAINPK
jgi:streptogramin lyase